jgi:hypothetical protein
MNETWKKIGWSALLALALAIVIILNSEQSNVIMGATITFVVLMLGVWLLKSRKSKPVRGKPEEVFNNTRRFLKIVAKETDGKSLDNIRAQTQKMIVDTIDLVNDGTIETTKQAAQSLVIIQPEDYKKSKKPPQIANTLVALYLLADFQDTEVSDDTKTLIDDFIVGLKDTAL